MSKRFLSSVLLLGAVLMACKSKPLHSVPIGGACERDGDCPEFAECLQMQAEKKVCTKGCNPAFADSDPREACPVPTRCEEIEYTQMQGTRVLGTIHKRMCVPGT